MIRYGQYGRNASRIVKRYGKYGRKSKLNSEMQKKSRVNFETIWKIWKKSKLNSEKI